MRNGIEIEQTPTNVILRYKDTFGITRVGVFDTIGDLRNFNRLLGRKIREFVYDNVTIGKP